MENRDLHIFIQIPHKCPPYTHSCHQATTTYVRHRRRRRRERCRSASTHDFRSPTRPAQGTTFIDEKCANDADSQEDAAMACGVSWCRSRRSCHYVGEEESEDCHLATDVCAVRRFLRLPFPFLMAWVCFQRIAGLL